MRESEKILLHTLQEPAQDISPLQKVKAAMGSVGTLVGNPLSKTEITLQISLTFWDGILAVPVLPAALPAFLQTSIPVFIFGLTDYNGGFLRSLQLTVLNPPWVTFGAGLPGIVGVDILAPPGTNAVSGDLVVPFNYTDVITNINANIIIHCNNVAYGTFLNSFVSDLITIDVIRYIVPAANINQFINPIIFGTQTLFGKVHSDSLDPRLYITNKDFQPQISDIPIDLPIDKTLMIGLQMDVFCPNFSWVLFVKKVEPLTHK
jgi:hypothetical protein